MRSRAGKAAAPGYHAITVERFRDARERLKLSQAEAAALLHVSTRTVRNWELGKTGIPYAAFRLLRIAAGHELPSPDWSGWSMRRGVLVAPNGRTFEAWQIEHIQWVFAAARLWLQEHAIRAAARKTDSPPLPSSAVALAVLYHARARRRAAHGDPQAGSPAGRARLARATTSGGIPESANRSTGARRAAPATVGGELSAAASKHATAAAK